MDGLSGLQSQSYMSANLLNNSSKTSNLEATLKNKDSSDEELMNACKSFESYMLEQIFQNMEKTVMKDEEKENDYMAQFGNKLYEEYAKEVTENQSIGLAQMLYESMKRNS